MKKTIPTYEAKSALNGYSKYCLILFSISGLLNILALTGSLYMLQIYDRVLASRSVPTLIALSVLAGGLYVFYGVLDVLRSQILVRLGGRLDQRLTPLAHTAALVLPLRGASAAESTQPIRDVDSMRAFLAGQGPGAIFDLPWMPLYVAFTYMLNPWLGALALGGMSLHVLIAWISERYGNARAQETVRNNMHRNTILDAHVRNAEVLKAMGLGEGANRRFEKASTQFLNTQARMSDFTSLLLGISKVLRMVLQSALLGVGAYLAIRGEITPGAIIAASIAGTRAVAPVELAIANWRGFVGARQGYRRLQQTLATIPARQDVLELSPPSNSLTLESVSVGIPGSHRVVLSDVSFALTAGQALGVIGPSASGKSSLVRSMIGVWPVARGTVRIDGAALDRWQPEALGRSIGYLPQDVELFDGTITENICRFEDNPDSRAVLAAAAAAGVHEMILRLPEGYETRVGPSGSALSAGQRQRVALARALYREPFLTVLDEPNSNLDSEGEMALAAAIQSVRARGGILVVVSHRPSVLAAVDLIAVIGHGQLSAIGSKDDVLRKALRPTAVGAT